MKTLSFAALFALTLLFFSCTPKSEPSEVGELMSAQEIINLPKDDSYNEKLIAIDGYWAFDSRLIKGGKKNRVIITSEPNNKAQVLIKTEIYVKFKEQEGTLIAGSLPRNYLRIDRSSNEPQETIVTDDYTEISDNQKLRFSGNLIYNDGTYELQNVTIHTIQ